MIHWYWLLLSGFAGFALGLFAIRLLAAGAIDSSYRAGFQEGVECGFDAGIKKMTEVG